MRFPYRKINLKNPFSSKQFILRPIVPLSIKYGEKTLRYEALIDSGADFNIFPLEIAEKLGIKFKENKKLFFTGIAGDPIAGKMAEIVIELGNKKVSAKAVFAEVGNGILGQYGFFDILQVKFDLKNKEIVIE